MGVLGLYMCCWEGFRQITYDAIYSAAQMGQPATCPANGVALVVLSGMTQMLDQGPQPRVPY